jgi:SAM-dependent methyltransferase
MINNREEYARMFEVERTLWWYQILHGNILKQIRKHFKKEATDLKILDAACGTGGLLSILRDNGYSQLTGFDYSQHAIDFSLERNLDVSFGDLRKVDEFRPSEKYDIIICNDALYFLSDQEIEIALKNFKSRLTERGIFLINIHAFNAFMGTHDLAVGSTRRFTFADFEGYTKAAEFTILHHTYWPFFLSFPILLVRQWQRFQLNREAIDPASVDSDVSYPGNFINTILRAITKTEQAILGRAPFGSSLFLVLKGK